MKTLCSKDMKKRKMVLKFFESIIYRHENSMLKRYEKKKDGPQILAMLEPTVLETKSRYLKDKLYKIREIV
jgi:hypothetical protein